MAPGWSPNTAPANPKPRAQHTTRQSPQPMLQFPPLPAELSPSLCRFVPLGSKGKKCHGCTQPRHLNPGPTGSFGEEQSSPPPAPMGLRQRGSDAGPLPSIPAPLPSGTPGMPGLQSAAAGRSRAAMGTGHGGSSQPRPEESQPPQHNNCLAAGITGIPSSHGVRCLHVQRMELPVRRAVQGRPRAPTALPGGVGITARPAQMGAAPPEDSGSKAAQGQPCTAATRLASCTESRSTPGAAVFCRDLLPVSVEDKQKQTNNRSCPSG